MRTLLLIVGVTALLFGMTASLAAAEISGVVVADHDRSPVVAAAVTVRRSGAVVAELETDDQGRFQAANVPAGEYSIDVQKSGFVALERRVIARTADVKLSLRVVKHGAITGTVLDYEGRPVRNAVVNVVSISADGGRVLPGRGAVGGSAAPAGVATDSRGVYRIHSLAPGSYAVALALGETRGMIASVRGLVPDTSMGNSIQLYPSSKQPQAFTFRGGEEYAGINFSAYRGPVFTINGTVYGSTGSYRVMLQNADVRTIALGYANVAPGRGFEFTRVPPGVYRVVAMSQQTYMQELPPDLVLPANIPPGITIVEVRPGVRAVVNGVTAGEFPPNAQGTTQVFNPTEPTFGETTVVVGNQDLMDVAVPTSRSLTAKLVFQPAEGCDPRGVILMNPMEDWGSGATSRPMEAGREVTLSPAPAPYTLSLNGSKCFLQQTEIDFRQASSSDAIPLVAMPYASIKGSIKTAGLPAADEYEVALTPPGGVTQWRWPDAQANFSFGQLRPGPYRVAVYPASGDRSAPLAMKELDVALGASVEVEFPQLP